MRSLIRCRNCDAKIAWEVYGHPYGDPHEDPLYVETQLPHGMILRRTDDDGLRWFGYTDRHRLRHKGYRSGGRDQAAHGSVRLLDDVIREARGFTGKHRAWGGISVRAPIGVWCGSCGAANRIGSLPCTFDDDALVSDKRSDPVVEMDT